jgi:hypothetical protein
MYVWSFPGGGIESTEEKKNSGWDIECTENWRKQSVDICIKIPNLILNYSRYYT